MCSWGGSQERVIGEEVSLSLNKNVHGWKEIGTRDKWYYGYISRTLGKLIGVEDGYGNKQSNSSFLHNILNETKFKVTESGCVTKIALLQKTTEQIYIKQIVEK